MTSPASSNAMHALTIGTILTGLRNTTRIMDKANVHVAAHGIAMENMLQTRLYPDMFNLLQQLQYVPLFAEHHLLMHVTEKYVRALRDRLAWFLDR